MSKKDKRALLKALVSICIAGFLISGFKYLQSEGLVCGRIDKRCGPIKVEHTEKGWELLVDGKPFFVKGVCYQYAPVGKGENYDVFSGYNSPWIIDGALMKKMGVNAVRFYRPGKDPELTKRAIRTLFNKYGIRSALGHYLDFWNWPPPNYADPVLREKIMNEVLERVRTYKDEKGILFWILGNENNYSFDRGVREWSTDQIDALKSPREEREAKARIYYSFINDIAKKVKEIDPNHPVVMGNGELTSVYIAKDLCPDVDILGGIVYQGKTFGTYFQRLERNLDKPNVFIEFGADRYDALKREESEDWQAFFIKLQWLEIYNNRAGGKGEGNSLGGFVFEWTDEWWKHDPGHKAGWNIHDKTGNWSNTAYYFDAKAKNNMNEEWFGVVGIDKDNMNKGIEKREPKKAFYVLRKLWSAENGTHSRTFGILAILFLALGVILLIVRSKSR